MAINMNPQMQLSTLMQMAQSHSESIQKRMIQHLMTAYPEYNDYTGLIQTIVNIARCLQKGYGFRMEASPLFKREIIVLQSEFHVVQRKAGAGGYSSAYFTTAIPLDGANPLKRLVKISKRSFQREVLLLNELSPLSKRSRKIDHFIGSFALLEGKGFMGVFNPSDHDLIHVDYLKFGEPVAFIIRQLIDMLDGIASFHRRDFILCDIKGANLLVNKNGTGKVTDFGLIRKMTAKGEKHNALGTASYVAPYIWDCILGQKYWQVTTDHPCSGGFQGKASDIFSIGRVIQIDIFPELMDQIAKEFKISDAANLLPVLFPKRAEGSFTDKELIALEKKYKNRIFFDVAAAQQSKGKDVFYIFEHREVVYKKTLEVIQKLHQVLSKDECKRLEMLANLGMELQNPSKEGLLKFLGCQNEHGGDVLINQVKDRLAQMLRKRSPSCNRKLTFNDPSNRPVVSGGFSQFAANPLSFSSSSGTSTETRDSIALPLNRKRQRGSMLPPLPKDAIIRRKTKPIPKELRLQSSVNPFASILSNIEVLEAGKGYEQYPALEGIELSDFIG